MAGCVIYNPNAGSAGESELLTRWLSSRPDLKLLQTESTGHARDLAAQSVDEGCELIVAAGGDGTINEVVNGLAANFAGVKLGIVPLGTGNDLARTLALPGNLEEVLDLLEIGADRKLDLIEVRSAQESAIKYCINVAAGGFSGQVDEVLTDEMKATWGPLAYLLSAASILPNLEDYQTVISVDGGAPETMAVLSVIIANARTAAGGYRVAPHANPEDGLLDVVIVQRGSALDLAGVVARLLSGDYTQSDCVLYRRAREITVDSRPGMWFNVDGELLTKEPVTFRVLPQTLRVIVGPEYTPDVSP